ncbi:MAG: A/G-specific adenine glycosylase [Pseudomonadota bacterium]|nr:A/G-specific adenine glycosylase [Pseudomonadota bacterium]
MTSNINPSTKDNSQQILEWYDVNRREFPWRARPGAHPNIYHVWLSEIMLQQTRAAAVVPYFTRFIDQWPTLGALARAPREKILHAWAGLGYYARARNLHASAQILMEQHNGKFPCSIRELKSLPGVGPYTASAISAIGFNMPTTVIDANVERILARLFTIDGRLPQARKLITQMALTIFPKERPGDFAQAMMDLGAQICTPKRPDCAQCPWSFDCKAYASGTPDRWPIKKPTLAKGNRFGIVFLVRHPNGAILLQKRPDHGLLGGMTEIISSKWLEQPISPHEIPSHAPISNAKWSPLKAKIQHTFSHFNLELEIYTTKSTDQPTGTFWCALEDLNSQPFPSLMRKVISLVTSTGEK